MFNNHSVSFFNIAFFNCVENGRNLTLKSSLWGSALAVSQVLGKLKLLAADQIFGALINTDMYMEMYSFLTCTCIHGHYVYVSLAL